MPGEWMYTLRAAAIKCSRCANWSTGGVSPNSGQSNVISQLQRNCNESSCDPVGERPLVVSSVLLIFGFPWVLDVIRGVWNRDWCVKPSAHRDVVFWSSGTRYFVFKYTPLISWGKCASAYHAFKTGKKKHLFMSFDLDSLIGGLCPQSPRHLRDNIQRESHEPVRPSCLSNMTSAAT